MEQILFYTLSAILIIIGLIGVFVPALPGVVIIFLGILVASFAADFSFISPYTIGVLGALTVISLCIDYFSGALGAKYAGASAGGVGATVLGSIFGTVVLGPLGIFLGPALGVFVFEYYKRKDLGHSTKVAKYALLSSVLGLGINLVIALVMLAIFISAIVVN
jgi:uncharacterized protein YqgC (DUF456 family)